MIWINLDGNKFKTVLVQQGREETQFQNLLKVRKHLESIMKAFLNKYVSVHKVRMVKIAGGEQLFPVPPGNCWKYLCPAVYSQK